MPNDPGQDMLTEGRHRQATNNQDPPSLLVVVDMCCRVSAKPDILWQWQIALVRHLPDEIIQPLQFLLVYLQLHPVLLLLVADGSPDRVQELAQGNKQGN